MSSPAPVTSLPRPTATTDGASDVSADVAALEAALRDARVTFNDVASCWFHLCDERVPAAQRARCEELFPRLKSAFGTPRGGIITAYFCRHLKLAAALTDIHKAAELGESLEQLCDVDDEPSGWVERRRARHEASSSALHVESALGEPADCEANEILFRCLDLHYRAIEFLDPKPRKVCLRTIMGIVCQLLGLVDRHARDGAPLSGDDPELACLRRVLEQANGYYDRSAQRQAQVDYFGGMAVGLALLVGGLFGIGLLAGAGFGSEPLLYTPLAAALGAFVSVLARMTRGQLALSYESGPAIMRLLGGTRPLLGALLGSALYVLVEGGLLTLPVDGNGQQELFFYIGLAFIAGFSERFAQDMLARTPGAGGGRAPAPGAVAARPPAGDPHAAR